MQRGDDRCSRDSWATRIPWCRRWSTPILSRHNFILLGLRGQAKTRLIRLLTTLLDEVTPYIEGCEIHDNPYRPICRRCRDLIAEKGDDTPIAWLDAATTATWRSWPRRT